MFYCNEDAEKRDWPITLFQSFGRCEICGERRVCNDLPSSELPEPKIEGRQADTETTDQ